MPYGLFIIAVAASAQFGGFWEGMIATFLAVLIANWLFVDPRHLFKLSSLHDLVTALSYLVIGLIISYFAYRTRVARLAAEQAADTAKRAEEKASEALEFNRAILSNMGEGLYTLDVDAKVTYINPAGEAMVGWSSSELLGLSMHDAVHHHHPDGRTFPVEDCISLESLKAGITMTNHEDIFIRKDGTLFPVLYSSSPIMSGGKIAGLVVAFQDITDRKLAEEEHLRLETRIQQAQKLESIGILAGGIAHDFNNLLSALFGYIDLAREFAKKGSFNNIISSLDSALKAFERAKSLTSRLLTFSEGGFPVKKTIELSSLLKEAAEFALSGSTAKCDFSIASNLWTCDLDENQISQVIDNIMLNAKDAMPEGGIVYVRADNISASEGLPDLLPGGDYVRVSIEDRGAGISDMHLKHIFDPFFTTKEKGSGLGLPIAYSIVSKHGGTIEVNSKEGQGTTFSIYLPASKKKIEEDSRVPPKAEEPRQGKILIMDDEDMILDVERKILEQVGYRVDCVKDGDEALRIYREALQNSTPFNAVILALKVERGMGGLEALQQLLEISPSIKAIVSSRFAEDPVLQAPASYGFKGKVTKPYQAVEIREELDRVLRSS